MKTLSGRSAALASVGALAAILVASAPPSAAATPAARCEADIEGLTGKYFKCVQDAEARFTRRGDAAKLASQKERCREAFDHRVSAVVDRANGACPSGLTPEEYRDFLDSCSSAIGDAATTGQAPECGSCGNGVVDLGEQCDGANLAGETCQRLGFTAGGTLACDAYCGFATGGCAAQRIPATGQSQSYGPGSDGDSPAGAPLAYRDNGDGTITDLNTGLMWEKKDDSTGIHGQYNTYSWSIGGTNLDGTIVSEFLATLNDVAGGGANCFAGHCDWRLPNLKEAFSLVDYGRSFPVIDPIFHQAATCTGCSDITQPSCSCGRPTLTVTSSTTTDPANAYGVDFAFGDVASYCKASSCISFRVRAVRGPS